MREYKLYRFGESPANSFIRRKSFQLKTFPFKETASERRYSPGNSIAIDCVAPITQLLGSVKCQTEIGIQPIYLPYNLLRNSCTGASENWGDEMVQESKRRITTLFFCAVQKHLTRVRFLILTFNETEQEFSLRLARHDHETNLVLSVASY